MYFIKKKRFNFNLGTTSYIIPYEKDNLVRNVKYVSKFSDIVQLLFFSKDYLSEVMEESIIYNLLKIKHHKKLDYIIHLPIDLDLMNCNENKIDFGFNIVEKIILKTEILKVNKFILHIDRFENFTYPQIINNEKNKEIFEQNLKIFKILEEKYDVKILIENTSYDLTYYWDSINKYNYNICLDFGHLFLYNHSIFDFFKKFSNRILLVHIHGVNNNKDHASLALNKIENNHYILEFLKSYNFDVVIEVFNKNDFFNSLTYLYENYKR